MTYQKGSIVRLQLTNFVTYSSLDFKPGNKLNILIGPNGSGKSTIVCAIILGLGGKPQIIGRSSHVGDYVKEGQDMAKIILELYNPDGHNFVITRTITSQGASKWYLQKNMVHFKKVEELIEKLNIQIDNLCQMLPQDRVQDFAKMNSKELLENTQKSIGCAELPVWFNRLKELRGEMQQHQIKIDSQSQSYEDRLQKLQRLEVEVQSFSTRQNMLKKITVMRQKLAWLLYEEKHTERNKVNDEQKDVLKDLTDIENQLRPLIQKIKISAKNEEKIRTKIRDHNQTINLNERTVKQYLKNQAEFSKEISRIKEDLASKLAAESQRELDIANLKAQIEEMEKVISQYPEEKLLRDIDICENEITELNKKASEARYLENDVRNKASVLNQTIRALEHKLTQAKSINEKKVEILKQYDHVYSAYNWFTKNKSNFSSPIYGPMFIELNVKNKNYAGLVEHIIPGRDLTAFICEDVKDVTKVMRILRDQMNLKINVVHSSAPNTDIKDLFQPRYPISAIRQYGFKGYLIDIIEGPASVLKYLCAQFKLHDIPFADDMPIEQIEKIPPDIRVYFLGSKLIRINTSKYSGEQIKLITETGPAKLLSFSVDTELIAQLDQEFTIKSNQMENINKNIFEVNEVKRNIEIDVNKIRGQKRELLKNLEFRKSHCVRLRLKEDELNRATKHVLNPEEETKKAQELQTKKCREMKKNLKTFTKLFGDFVSAKKLEKLLEKDLSCIIAATADREMKSSSLEKKHKELKCTYEKIKMTYAYLKNEEKELYKKAESLCNGLNPDHPDFIANFLSQFKKFPNEVNALEGKIQESEAMARCLKNPEEEIVLKNYETIKTEVESLTKELEINRARCTAIEEEINEIWNKWYPKLDNLVQFINERFSKFFQSMGCVGVVELDKGTVVTEYEKYGLSIRVKFRDEHQLQKLDAHVQSGGERALTTAVFLLSLQGITNVPFRCVDEINQGMDEFNERRVYELLSNTISHCDTAQYFLLTPKLLHNLTYSPGTYVHCVYNSASALTHEEWSIVKFIEKLSSMEEEDNSMDST